MTKRLIIAMDGFSSTGKSSISKVIAKKLGIIHMDTGALYRGITYYALQHCLDTNGEIDLSVLINDLPKIQLKFEKIDNELVIILNEKNISKEIRFPQVSENVSLIAKQSEVRQFLLATQRNIAEKGSVIMDGRDIGTVVFPHADYKFFLTASSEERAKRRYIELLNYDEDIDMATVKANLLHRDKIDSEREISPLKQAEDAILIDNTHLTKQETIDLILSYIE